MPEASVLCVGILVADLVVPPLARLPAAGELIATEDFLVQPGGCAANTAIALRTLGLAAAVVGRVGDDLFGDLVERDLRARGIDTSGVARTAGHGTSKTVILPVVDEDRRFIHTFGANAALTAADIPPVSLEAADVTYVGGYLVLPALHQSDLAARFRFAREQGTRIVLDVVVPSGLGDLSVDAVSELLPLADYFLPNEDEARALTGEAEPLRQAERLLEAGARTVVIKRGERGVLVHSGDEVFELAAPRVDVLEPSGAGDAFAAGLILGMLEGWELERSARFASVMGGSACTALGCYAGVFSRDEADRFIMEHPAWARDVPRS
ncbi:MAG: sugar kinase [Thermoleophilia bacterium]|nr:sugar kinase [Thermoleophilia bacterium]MDH5281775.1 sugar kinase [Thermoleophilia bacterium]